MLTSLCGQPSSFFGCSNNHLEVLSLSGVSDVNNSICLDLVQSVVDSSKICTIIVVATIRFDSNKWDRIFFNENAFGFSSFVTR